MLMAPVDHTAMVPGGEPRMFPGLVHERTRRQSLRLSTSNSGTMANGALQDGLFKTTTKDREVLTGAMEEEPGVEDGSNE